MEWLGAAASLLAVVVSGLALWRADQARALVNRAALLSDLRPLVEQLQRALGDVVAAGGVSDSADAEVVSHAIDRLCASLNGVADEPLHDRLDRLATLSRRVYADRRPADQYSHMSGGSRTNGNRASKRTADAAREGEQIAFEALQRMSQIRTGQT